MEVSMSCSEWLCNPLNLSHCYIHIFIACIYFLLYFITHSSSRCWIAAGRLTHLAQGQPSPGSARGDIQHKYQLRGCPGQAGCTWPLCTRHIAVWPRDLFLPQPNIFVIITLGLSVGGPPWDRRGFSEEPEPFSNCRAIFLGSFDLTWIFESWAS